MANIKMIALDMDGTLLNQENEVSENNRKAIARAMDKGVDVVLSTGRRLDTSFPYATSLGLSTYLVTCNGGQIWTMSKQLLEEHLLDPTLVERMYRIGERIGVDMWFVATTGLFQGSIPDDAKNLKWLKFGCSSFDHAKLQQARKELSQLEGIEMTNSLPTNLELNPKGVNKAVGLERVCRELNISLDNVLAAGDSLNDIKMIEACGIGVAMGNAQDPVKQAADFVTDTNINDGVAKAIEQFLI